jgi:epoxyqueuosine reductase
MDYMLLSAQNIKERALALGFNLVGITRAEPSPTLAAYQRWIDAGMHAEMGYMARPDRVVRRENLATILPDVRSLLIVGLDYRTLIPDGILHDPTRGRIASYAWGLDYHDLMTPRLEQLAAWLHAETHGTLNHRVYVDTGAILERSHAQQAGLGFIGKNTMLIQPRRGSYFFIGEILLTLDVDSYDTPHRATMCGTCIRCMAACPTDAFPQPYVLDARRCISYHTIENKGWIPRELRPQFGNWVYGCDVCQEVCPFQRFAPPTREADFVPLDINRAAPPLAALLTLDETTFQAAYAGSPIARIKRAKLVRNACIAAGNSQSPQFIPALEKLLSDASPLVRGHAAWGLWQLARNDAGATLKKHHDLEQDIEVRAEVAALLNQAE